MNVYTYFQALGPSPENEKQKSLLEFWRKDWQLKGWNPTILGEEDARAHGFFTEYLGEIKKIKTSNSHAYEKACMIRHLAMSVRGGGLLVDYDVFNLDFRPEDLPAIPGPLILGLGVPCAVWGSAAAFEMLCKSMAPHCKKFSSDMHIIQHLKVPGVYTCREFPDASGKMIHFPAGKIGSEKLEFIQTWLQKNRRSVAECGSPS